MGPVLIPGQLQHKILSIYKCTTTECESDAQLCKSLFSTRLENSLHSQASGLQVCVFTSMSTTEFLFCYHNQPGFCFASCRIPRIVSVCVFTSMSYTEFLFCYHNQPGFCFASCRIPRILSGVCVSTSISYTEFLFCYHNQTVKLIIRSTLVVVQQLSLHCKILLAKCYYGGLIVL